MRMIRKMFYRLVATSAVPVLLATPALADPTVGFGLSISFGKGAVETGIGVRIFSDDEE